MSPASGGMPKMPKVMELPTHIMGKLFRSGTKQALLDY